MEKKDLLNEKVIEKISKLSNYIPCELMQPIANAAFDNIMIKHGQAFDLLKDFKEPIFLINPTDFPLFFKLKPYGTDSYLKIYKTKEGVGEFSAEISGKSNKLIELLEGKVDGDSLFFSRELVISGDTQAVVAFRNAIENTQIDVLNDFLSNFDALKEAAMGSALVVGSKISSHLDNLRSFILEPALDKIDELNCKLEEIKNEKNS